GSSCASSVRRIEMQGITKVAVGRISCGVCRQSGEERGTVLGVNLAGNGDRELKKMYSCSTKEAIRTGTLSERWRHLWPKVLDLIFHHPNTDNLNASRIDISSKSVKSLVFAGIVNEGVLSYNMYDEVEEMLKGLKLSPCQGA
ncbi:hypothetical protein Tco_1265573, partial [Tanacetum coccineum]